MLYSGAVSTYVLHSGPMLTDVVYSRPMLAHHAVWSTFANITGSSDMQFGAAVVVCAETSTGCLIGGDAIAISKPQVSSHVLLMLLLISGSKDYFD